MTKKEKEKEATLCSDEQYDLIQALLDLKYGGDEVPLTFSVFSDCGITELVLYIPGMEQGLKLYSDGTWSLD